MVKIREKLLGANNNTKPEEDEDVVDIIFGEESVSPEATDEEVMPALEAYVGQRRKIFTKPFCP